MLNVEISTNLSILVQVITGLVSFRGVYIQLPPQHQILSDILKLETIVQVVELVFYIFFLKELSKTVKSMAKVRYYDWVITTPTMLLTTIMYFKYEEHIEKSKEKPLSFTQFVKEHQLNIAIIVISNALMLLFGYLGEIGKIDKWTANFWGFLFFIIAFRIIYTDYAQHSDVGKRMFKFLLTVWSLYGIAFLFPDNTKNHSFNALDIVAKNFFGLYLYYKVVRLSNNQ